MLFIIFFIFLSLGTTISQDPQYILEDDYKQQSFAVDENYETDQQRE